MRVFGRNNIDFNVNFSSRMTINSSGQVTINALGGSGDQVVAVNNTGTLGIYSIGDSILWRVNGNEIYNKNSGNVLIGTSTNGTGKLLVDNSTSTVPNGIEINNAYTGASVKYGLLNTVTNSGTGTRYGVRNNVSSTSDVIYGTVISLTPGIGTAYGILNSVSASGTSGSRYGEYT